MSKILFAGPFVGEFGWEIMAWQAYVRFIADQYDKVIISSRTSSKFLYEDFYDEFVPFDPGGDYVCNMYGGCGNSFNINKLNEYPEARIIIPENHRKIAKYFPTLEQKFIHYKSDEKVDDVDLVFHARKYRAGNDYKIERDWDEDKWNELANTLINRGYRIASIGVSDSSFCPDGTYNYLDKDLKVISSLLNKCKIILGASSGPMHFASLCKCPHFVWTSNVKGRGFDNKERYEVDWNPLDTPVFVYNKEGWNPTIEKLIPDIEKFIESVKEYNENRLECS